MYFYFEQLFRDALTGINGTTVLPTIVQVATAILVATLLFNVYEAFVRGGDVRTLGVGAVKYLVLGLVLMNYSSVFLGVNTMFNQVAESISRAGPGGLDVFNRFADDLANEVSSNPDVGQSLWGLVTGSIAGALSIEMLLLAFVVYAVAYAIFCVFYAFYGSVLYVCGPLVLALYPAMSTTSLARTYLTNLIIFHAWGVIYAILGCLLWAIHLGTVSQVLARKDAAGFFAGLGDALLLGLASILLALCVALIPFIARRLVQGDVGSTLFAVVGAAMTAATAGATVAMNGLAALGGSGGGGGGGSSAATAGGSAGGSGAGQGGGPALGVASQSSQAPPRPPDGGDPPAASAAAGRSSGRRWKTYTPMDVAAMASSGAGAAVGYGYRKMRAAFGSGGSNADRED
jgi:hypothetical protein